MLFAFVVRNSLLTGLCVCLLASPTLAAKEAESSSIDQPVATELVTRFMSRYHYRKPSLDDALSVEIFERFVEGLDPNRSYFLATDIERFRQFDTFFDDWLKTGNLDYVFAIYQRYKKRLADRVEFSNELLNKELDFSRDEQFMFDRSEAKWAASMEELNDLWRRRIKNDILILKISGEGDEQVGKTLKKRYDRLLQRSEQLNRDDIFQLLLNAFTTSVDPHSSYFSPRASENFRIRMSLSLEGIGAALQTESDYTIVRRIIPGGPADLSDKLHIDDRIVGVGQGDDGEMVDVVSWRLGDVVELIRGPKGSTVRLRLLPKDVGAEGPAATISLVRNKIKLEDQAVKSKVLHDVGGSGLDIGVIDVPTFYLDSTARSKGEQDYRSTTRDTRKLIDQLVAQGIDGIVVDLRGNSGGSLVEATDLTGLFIETGPIVQLRDSSGRIQINRDSDPDIAYDGPLAVLVDRNSASASEIFAGAIQDYRRGHVIGEPTYGKGTVQNLVDLDRYAMSKRGKLGQLKVTIAQFFRVNGDSTQHRGVVPDVVFPTADSAREQGERALENALPWAAIAPTDFSPAGDNPDMPATVRSAHIRRITNDPAFQLLMADVDERAKVAENRTVTLNEAQRRSEQALREKTQKTRVSRLRELVGLPPESEDTGDTGADEDRTAMDLLLTETANILADVVRANQHASVHNAAGDAATR